MTLELDPSPTDLREALSRLRADPNAYPWTARHRIASALSSTLSSGPATEPYGSLVGLLAKDGKWEVRKRIAETLADAHDADFCQILEMLRRDGHHYVRRAAEVSAARRATARRETGRRRRGIELVIDRYEQIESKFGREAADEARALAEAMYDVLVGTAVHEMRGILTTLVEDNGRVHAALDAEPPDVPTAHRRTRKSGERLAFLARLLQDMRSYAQPVSRDRTEVPLRELVDEAVMLVTTLLGKAEASPRITVKDSSPVIVRVSRVHVVNALLNVIKNGWEAIEMAERPEGRVEIETQIVGDEVAIRVRDNGCGIPASSLGEVRQFIPGRTSKRNKGTGFGLCSARRNIEAHGGQVLIQSVEDVSTTVTLVLPVAKKGEP